MQNKRVRPPALPLLPLRLHPLLQYMAEMIVAVATVHRLGYIHRDLKPDNILLDWQGHLKLTDLGLSKKASKHTLVWRCFLCLCFVFSRSFFRAVRRERGKRSVGKGHRCVSVSEELGLVILPSSFLNCFWWCIRS